MKRKISLLVLIALLITFGGCQKVNHKSTVEDVSIVSSGDNESDQELEKDNYIDKIQDGLYQTSSEDLAKKQSININKKDSSISYSTSLLSSYMAFGKYILRDDTLSFTDDSGKEYEITILEDGNLKYNGTIFYYEELDLESE